MRQTLQQRYQLHTENERKTSIRNGWSEELWRPSATKLEEEEKEARHTLHGCIHCHLVNKKAQLTLTNPSEAKACRRLLQFYAKTSCRQDNDLFEVMQQPSAPSGKWYWRILLENSVFPTHTCLMPHNGWKSFDINVTYTSLKSAFNGLQFRHWKYGSIFIHLAVIVSETREMSWNSKIIWPYSSSRSSKVKNVGVNRKPIMWLPISH